LIKIERHGLIIMQKIVNIIAIASGVISITLVGSGIYVYVQRDQLIDNVKSQVLQSVTGSLGGLAGGAVDSKMPKATGPAVGLGVPSVPGI
tara:strand:- start:10312 stop:10584 length:273 start_codon:yes stop_codon:yes gene_type:complete